MGETKQVTTGGAAGSDQIAPPTAERGLNDTSTFATEISPNAQVTGAATLTNVFPEDVSQFQDIQTEYFTGHKAEVTARQEMGGYKTDFSDTSKSTKEIMNAAGPGHTEAGIISPEGSTTAYASANVEDTMVAFQDTGGSEETGESGEEYYYGEAVPEGGGGETETNKE